MKVCVDAGHYGKYNHSPVLSSYWESDMTWKLSGYLSEELKKWGIEVVETRTNKDVDRELVSRGYAAKGCDLFVSEHSNAAASSTANYAVCIYMRANDAETYDEKSREIAKLVAKTTADTMGVGYSVYCREYIGDRDGNGKADDEWYGVLQGCKQAEVPGIIIENGFHTNLHDAEWLSKDANLRTLAVNQAKTIANWLGVDKKPSKKKYYYVQVGAYTQKKNAENQVKELSDKGFKAIIKNQGGFYRVQAGAYTSLKNAKAQVDELKKAGFSAIIKE